MATGMGLIAVTITTPAGDEQIIAFDPAMIDPAPVTDAEVYCEATALAIEAMAAEIQRRGWTQGKLTNPDTGAVCLVGGLTRVPAISSRRQSAVLRVLDEYLLASGGYGYYGRDTHPAAWNDLPTTTYDDVINLCAKTAAWVREKA